MLNLWCENKPTTRSLDSKYVISAGIKTCWRHPLLCLCVTICNIQGPMSVCTSISYFYELSVTPEKREINMPCSVKWRMTGDTPVSYRSVHVTSCSCSWFVYNLSVWTWTRTNCVFFSWFGPNKLKYRWKWPEILENTLLGYMAPVWQLASMSWKVWGFDECLV